MTVRVLRVEHRVNKYYRSSAIYAGAYQDRYLLSEDAVNNMNNLPCPDRWWSGRSETIFAFRSKEALLRWFNNATHRELSEAGYVIAVYEVPREHVEFDLDGIQCAFDYRYAKKIQRKHWKDESTLFQLAA